MTDEAKMLLRAAAGATDDAMGLIMYLRTAGRLGVYIQAGDRQMIPPEADARTVQAWIGGLEELVDAGYIRATDAKGECFEG